MMPFAPKRVIPAAKRQARITVPTDKVYRTPSIKGEVIERRPSRIREHPHALAAAGAPDLHRYALPQDDKHAKPRGRHSAAVERNLATLPPEQRRSEDEIFDDLIEQGLTATEAATSAHQEMAATILAAGGTMEEAGDHAGVSAATVRKYWDKPEFQAMVMSRRALVLSRVQGHIVMELERRTRPGIGGEPGEIDKLATADLLRIHDRTTGGGSGRNSVPQGTSVTVNVGTVTYDTIVAAIVAPDATAEGEDLPGSGFDLVSLSGPGT